MNEYNDIEIDFVEACESSLSKDSSLLVNKKFANLLGIEAAIYLSALIWKAKYFAKNKMMKEPSDWFFNTQDDMKEATCLPYHKQTKVLEILKEYHLIDIEKRGVPAKNYFKIKYDMIFLISTLKQEYLNDKSISILLTGQEASYSLVKKRVNDYINIIKKNIINEKEFSKENSSEAKASPRKSSLSSPIRIRRRESKPIIPNETLRDKAKQITYLNKKKTEAKQITYPEAVTNKYIYWKRRGLHIYNSDARGYQKDLQAINNLLQGKAFAETEFNDEYGKRKFTVSEIHTAINNFALYALNMDYEPANIKYKKALSKKDFSWFVYCRFTPDKNDMPNGFGKSMFLHCLNNSAKLLKEKDVYVDNLYPDLTRQLKEKYVRNVLGISFHKFSNKEENEFRKAANHWHKFFNDNRKNLWGEFTNPAPDLIAETIMETFQKNNNENLSSIQPWMFNRGLLLTQVPAYLKHQGVIVEDGSIYPQRSRQSKSAQEDFSISLYDDE